MGILLLKRIRLLRISGHSSSYGVLGVSSMSSNCFIHTVNSYEPSSRHTRYVKPNNFSVNKVSIYLERARLIDLIRLSLRSSSPESVVLHLNNPALDSFVVANALLSAPSPDSALSLIEALKKIPHFSHTQFTLYSLAKVLAKAHQSPKLKSLINAISSGKFMNVAPVPFMDRMRWFALAGDLDEVLSVWHEWRNSRKQPCTESYNIIMGLSAQTGKDYEAMETFRRMIDERQLPNSRTYTVIIEHLVNSGNLDSALDIFRILPSMRMKHTIRQYFILIGAFCDSGQFEVVKSLLSEMQIDGITPSPSMHCFLQLMHVAGFVEETSDLIKELLPDKRIKNVELLTDHDDDGEEDAESALPDANADCVKLKSWFDPAILASALNDWRPQEVSALDDAKFVWTSRLVCKMIRNFRSAETAWEFFCWVEKQPGFSHDVYTVSNMIDKSARKGQFDLVDQLVCMAHREGIKLSFTTFRLIIDFYGISGNGIAALKIFHDIKMLGTKMSKSHMLLLYSSLLRTLAKCKMDTEALDILDEMILCGIVPDIQTFSGLMHHFALQVDIKTMQRLYGMVRQCGIEPDASMFKVLIHAYCKCKRAALALRVFEDMRYSNMMPDAWTKQLLVKSLWKEGKLREAASVEEQSEELNHVALPSLPGQLYTVSSTDLTRVYEIYSHSINGIFRPAAHLLADVNPPSPQTTTESQLQCSFTIHQAGYTQFHQTNGNFRLIYDKS